MVFGSFSLYTSQNAGIQHTIPGQFHRTSRADSIRKPSILYTSSQKRKRGERGGGKPPHGIFAWACHGESKLTKQHGSPQVQRKPKTLYLSQPTIVTILLEDGQKNIVFNLNFILRLWILIGRFYMVIKPHNVENLMLWARKHIMNTEHYTP